MVNQPALRFLAAPVLLRWLLPAVFCAFPVAAPAASPGPVTPFQAKWIWLHGADLSAYNQAVLARKTFRLAQPPQQAVLRITADSFYRLFLNDQWVADGPCRSWPEQFQYDVLDVTPWLRPGENEIRILAVYYGVGDFHRVPQQAGLLAQLDLTHPDGQTGTIATDATWQVAAWPALAGNVPKISIQMSPAEWYDARREDNPVFRRAAVLFPAHGGPWKNLQPRDVALLTRQPFPFKSFLGAKLVRAHGWNFCVPAARLLNPGVVEANHNTGCGFGMATILEAEREVTFRLQEEGMKCAINGERREREVTLPAGRHLVLAFARGLFGHQKERTVRFLNPEGFTLRNPVQSGAANPWVFVRLPEFGAVTNDLVWIPYRDRETPLGKLARAYEQQTDQWLTTIRDAAALTRVLGPRLEQLPPERMFVEDPFWAFTQRQVVGDAAALVQHPAGLLHDNAEYTTVLPGGEGDVELLFDLGEQNCGYWSFDLQADAGVEVDIFAVEYIAPDGRIQFSWGNRNGLRYITRAGRNRFTSLKRRSGRYVFLTLRHHKTPVRIRHFHLIESTYPVEAIGQFQCSDTRLDRIWDISTRTLKLCMEDTFTDCPLYEQTHWVGDARNGALLAFGVFGAHDLARRCIRLTAESLGRFPITGCQTPSSWDVLIPAWSFLWGISTWDYYWETGDTEWLRGVYPAVLRNLQGAAALLNERDLFSGPFWNFFDWVNLDQGQKTVLHNSLLLVGATDAALREAAVLGDTAPVAWLQALRARLVGGINRLWDETKQAYPDAIRDDGSISPSISQHTSILALLYEVVPRAHAAAALRNLTNPPVGMVQVGSPFAALYLYEAFEKFGLEDEIIRQIYKHYLPMVEAGATTVWESFPSGTTGGGRFPTRSHAHAWSSAPSRFLNRIILGVKTTAPGAAAVQISPRLNGLTWAQGVTATARGPVQVRWKRDGSKLDVTYTVPAGVQAQFARNDTHAGLAVVVNGQPFE